MNLKADQYEFLGLGKINVILGLNGCGKSTCLRWLDSHGKLNPEGPLEKSYITPERGGTVKYQANVEQNMTTSSAYLIDDRRKNQTVNFKVQSVAHFRMLETRVLRKLDKAVGNQPEGELKKLKFDRYLADINSLLDQIKIQPSDSAFEIKHKASGQKIEPEQISSGESELISLAIECLTFEAGKANPPDKPDVPLPLLILDEPDVHLHPDLQVRLVQFLKKICERSNLRIVISTHSSAVLSALADYEHAKIYFMKSEDKHIKFIPISNAVKSMLPVFGAHPLSSIFNQSPVFLVEGTDEERLWQQAVRTARGKIKLFPVVAGDVHLLGNYEQEANKILGSVYENAKTYSLRDGDKNFTELADLAHVVRFRLKCYASENLMLTDEVLTATNTSWRSVKSHIDDWLTNNPNHQYFNAMWEFKNGNFDRQKHPLKDIRNILASFISNKAWEVFVGQTIGQLTIGPNQIFDSDGSIYTYLGEKLCNAILPPEP